MLRMTTYDGRLEPDETVRLEPDASLLGLQAGDAIQLDEQGFRRLSDALFVELGRRSG